MRRWWIAVAVVTLGCGEDEPTLEEQLQGAWSFDESNGCVQGLTFGDGQFTRQRVCDLEDGGFGVQVERGTYELTGRQLLLSVDGSSCADTFAHGEAVSVGLQDDDTLQVVARDAISLYQRVELGGGAGSAEFGCFDDASGIFTAGPVRPL